MLGVIKTKIKFADHVETARKTMVKAMKEGGIAVIDLSDVGPPNWKDKICQVEEYKTVSPPSAPRSFSSCPSFSPPNHALTVRREIYLRR